MLSLVGYTFLFCLIFPTSGFTIDNEQISVKEDSRKDIDYGLEPSPLTVEEGLKLLSPNLPTAIFKNRVKTTPILIGNQDILHWMMKDGSIWTKFENKSNDSVIIGYQYEKQ